MESILFLLSFRDGGREFVLRGERRVNLISLQDFEFLVETSHMFGMPSEWYHLEWLAFLSIYFCRTYTTFQSPAPCPSFPNPLEVRA